MFALRSIISPPQSLLANKESKLEEIDPSLFKKNVGKLVRNNLTITYFTPTIEIVLMEWIKNLTNFTKWITNSILYVFHFWSKI